MTETQLTPDAKRLIIVIEESGYDQKSFAAAAKVGQASVSRMVNGTQPIPLRVVKFVCYNLGYSPEWFVNGTGNKKKRSDDVKLVSEINMLRVEMNIMLAKNKMLEARMKSYEDELKDIKNSFKSV